MRVELPKGQWAELREADEVPERLESAITEAVADFNTSPEGVRFAAAQKVAKAAKKQVAEVDGDFWRFSHRLARLTITAYVTQWSFELPITEDGAGELGSATFKALSEACDKVAAGKPDFKIDPDPVSPTEPSNA